jgi:histidyl-tRNA synthetase
MIADAELMSLVYTMLERLGFADFTIKFNNRKLLTGIGLYAGVPAAQLPSLYRTIDKIDKIGLDSVLKELRKEGLPEETATRMASLLTMESGDEIAQRLAALAHLREELDGIEIAQEGIAELEELALAIDALGLPPANTALDFAMVRGLGYYTGPIFETIITKPDNLGSVQGGGRYDELIGLFRGQSLPMTGVSLGIERILDLMDLLDLYPPSIRKTVVQVLVTVFNDDLQTEALRLAMELRSAGVRAETYMDARKGLGKQIGYADSKGIPLVVIIGPDESRRGEVRLKRLADGYETTVRRAEVGAESRRLLGPA